MYNFLEKERTSNIYKILIKNKTIVLSFNLIHLPSWYTRGMAISNCGKASDVTDAEEIFKISTPF